MQQSKLAIIIIHSGFTRNVMKRNGFIQTVFWGAKEVNKISRLTSMLISSSSVVDELDRYNLFYTLPQ